MKKLKYAALSNSVKEAMGESWSGSQKRTYTKKSMKRNLK